MIINGDSIRFHQIDTNSNHIEQLSLSLAITYESALTECVKFSLTDLPSTTHVTEAGGLELEVVHSNLRLSPTFASLGPLIVTLSGATAKKEEEISEFLFPPEKNVGGQSDVLVPKEALERPPLQPPAPPPRRPRTRTDVFPIHLVLS